MEKRQLMGAYEGGLYKYEWSEKSEWGSVIIMQIFTLWLIIQKLQAANNMMRWWV